MSPTARLLTGDAWLLFATRFIRLFAYGALSVVLVFYLVGVGLDEVGRSGVLLTATLIGDTVVSLVLTTRADRVGRRRMLIARRRADGGRRRGLRLDQPVVAAPARRHDRRRSARAATRSGRSCRSSRPRSRTSSPTARGPTVFAWYTLAGSLATALGALAGGL